MTGKITSYAALAAPQFDDLLLAVDIHDTSMASSGTDKKITLASLTGIPVVMPSGDATGVTDAARITSAVAALPAQGGTIEPCHPSAPWYIACGSLAIVRNGVYLYAPGAFVSAVGTGDVIRMYATTGASPGGGILGYPVIDGTSAGAGY